eukprot:2790530-Prymnesium_polylepis.1
MALAAAGGGLFKCRARFLSFLSRGARARAGCRGRADARTRGAGHRACDVHVSACLGCGCVGPCPPLRSNRCVACGRLI